MNLIIRLLVTAVVAFSLTKFLSGVQFLDFQTAVVFAIVFGLLNTFVKPIFKIIGLPISILSLGLFSLVINAVVMLLADHFVEGMSIDGFLWALVFSIALSTISSIINKIIE